MYRFSTSFVDFRTFIAQQQAKRSAPAQQVTDDNNSRNRAQPDSE